MGSTAKDYGDGTLYRRKNAAGEEVGPYWCQYWVNGARRRESTGTTDERAARRFLRDKVAGGRAGTLPPPGANKLTVAEVLALVPRNYQVKGNKSLKRVKQIIAAVAAQLGSTRALRVTGTRLEQYVIDRREDGMADATIKYELAVLRRAFRLAKREKLLAEVPDFPTIALDNARQGFFEPDQFLAVRAKLPDYLRDVATFAYVTGWRIPSEVLTLTWADVNLEAGEVRLRAAVTKGKKARVFPFAASPELAALLADRHARAKAMYQATGEWVPSVFHHSGKPIRDCYTAWRKACREADVPGRLMHDFRRTAVRNLEWAGVPRSVAMQLTGHKTEEVYRRYAIVASDDLRAGVERLSVLHKLQAETATTPSHSPNDNAAPEGGASC
jgi:integrase